VARLQPSETGPWRPEPVTDPAYWKGRLDHSDGEVHRAVFNGSLTQFREIEEWQRAQLAGRVGDADSVLDAGCGYGRLLDLLPATWGGKYLGLDISPDLIAEARKRYAGAQFRVADLRDLSFLADHSYDVAVAVWMREMVLKNVGEGAWAEMERELRRVAKRLLLVATPSRGTD
jgi:SAM-dependent methyltransferase